MKVSLKKIKELDIMIYKDKSLSEYNRFNSLGDAMRHVGLIYMLAERLFYFLSYLSLKNIRFHIGRKVYGLSAPKFDPIRKDIFILFFFVVIGIVVPVSLLAVPDFGLSSSKAVGIFGIYLIIKVIQNQVNVTIFDNFRGNRLPIPKPGGKFWCSIEKICSWIIPRDLKAEDFEKKGYYLTSGPRRLLLAVMDFWLVFVGFSFVFWALIPCDFSQSIKQYSLSLYFSVVAGTTLGLGDISPTSIRSQVITMSETLICFLFALIIIANTLSLLPRSRELN